MHHRARQGSGDPVDVLDPGDDELAELVDGRGLDARDDVVGAGDVLGEDDAVDAGDGLGDRRGPAGDSPFL